VTTDPYAVGSWSCAYQVSPVADPPSATQLLSIIQQTKGHETGWPVWLILGNRPEMRPHLVGDVIECWLNLTVDQDFWRADPRGRMFLIRRLQEDTRDIQGAEPGRYFDLTLPVWRTGECLLHAGRFATQLGAEHVDLRMQWRGLAGRELATLVSPLRMLDPGRVATDNEVVTSIGTDAAAISDTLPELVRRLTEPLFARFDFFQPSTELYTSEIERMRRGV
jgi:hypothetical protein